MPRSSMSDRRDREFRSSFLHGGSILNIIMFERATLVVGFPLVLTSHERLYTTLYCVSLRKPGA